MKQLESLAAEAAEALASSNDPAGEDYPSPANEWRIQIRKACSYLRDAGKLQENATTPGTATSVVELSLCAVERTLQGALMRQHELPTTDFQRHRYAIEEADRRGLISSALAAHLSGLWTDFRNENYYRSGVPGETASRKTLEMARSLHLQLMRRRSVYRGACTCTR